MNVPALEVNVDARRLDGLFADCDRGDVPGVAVGLALNGTPAYRRGFGLAGIAPPHPLGPDTPLRIGSVSKHFLCLLLLELADAGLLSLDDNPCRHIPRLPAWAGRISLRQLMNHSSGMRCSLDLLLQTSGIGRTVPRHMQLELLRAQTAVNFAPGSGWCYNNGGYVLLGYIAEQIAGAPLEELLRRRLFEPAGLRDTALCRSDADLPPNAAVSHLPAADGGYHRSVFGPLVGGEGGIVSTVDDMLRWMARMSRTWDRLCAPRLANGYGLGIYSKHYRGARVVHHNGNVIGGTCQLLHLPDCGLDLIVITNRGDLDASALALRMIDATVTGLEPPPIDLQPAVSPEGDYHNAASGNFLRLPRRQERRQVQFHATPAPLRGTADGALAVDQINSDSRLIPLVEAGAVVALEVHEGGRFERLQRLPPADPSGADAMAAGHYRCDEVEAAAVIARQDGGLLLETRTPYGAMHYSLETLGPGLCLAATGNPLLPLGGLIEFDAAGFRFSSQRTRRLRFTRNP